MFVSDAEAVETVSNVNPSSSLGRSIAYVVPVVDRALQQGLRQAVRDAALHDALERPDAEDRIAAAVSEPVLQVAP